MSINEAFAEVILRSERATDRFERFCNAVVGKLEGDVEVFPTSASWDLGRDGRATTEKLFVCASLADDVDAKSERDAKRISENMRSPVRLYFCSSQPLSEKRCDEIASQLRALLPAGTDVQVLGSQQLAHAAEKHPDVFSAFYALEVNALNARLRDDAIAPNDDAALRLALIATTHETSDEVRTTLYRNAIRAVLRGKQLNLEESARDVTHIFRLAQGLPADSLRPHIDYLIEKGEVDRSGDRFALTARGEESLQIEQSQAQSELVAGRELIRARIEGGIGYRLADRQFDEIWRIIREKITAAFFERGQQLVAQVSALLNARTSEVQPDEPLFFLDDLASAVATTSSLPAQAEELRTAVKDMFEEPFGPAFEWLSKLCGAYVALCALGLEWHSGRALARVLSKMSLVLDTDIALSLLGEGEPNHAAVEGLVRRWTAIGGTVFVSKEVLHEVAHHAAIADYDFNQVRHWLPGRAEERLRLINNVLVRSFAHLLSEKRISPSQWQAYVNQFRRGGKEDPVKIAEIFAQEYSIRQLPPASNEELKTEEAAKAFLQARAAQGKEGAQAWIAHDKAGRDASLYAAIVRESRATRATDSERACARTSCSRLFLVFRSASPRCRRCCLIFMRG